MKTNDNGQLSVKESIRSENRKAIPVFILVIVVSMLAGFAIGYFSVRFGIYSLAGRLKDAGQAFGSMIAPWLLLLEAVAIPIISVVLYKRANKIIAGWSEEDEESLGLELAERRLSYAIWLTSAGIITSYLLLAASYTAGFDGIESVLGGPLLLVAIVSFLAVLVEAILIQQKCVDAAKRLYPEKKASVYDMRFHKKWLESCDEAEKAEIGMASMAAYKATNGVCSFLSVVLALSAMLLDIGFLPSLSVCIVWLVNMSAYFKGCVKNTKAK